jgi:hypothetical protein
MRFWEDFWVFGDVRDYKMLVLTSKYEKFEKRRSLSKVVF